MHEAHIMSLVTINALYFSSTYTCIIKAHWSHKEYFGDMLEKITEWRGEMKKLQNLLKTFVKLRAGSMVNPKI